MTTKERAALAEARKVPMGAYTGTHEGSMACMLDAVFTIDAALADPPAQAVAPETLSDERIERILGDAYHKLQKSGYNGGMGGATWDMAAARAIEAELRTPKSEPAP